MDTSKKIEELKERVGQVASFANDYIGVISYKEQGIVRDINDRLAVTRIVSELEEIFKGLDELKDNITIKENVKEEKKN